MIDAANSVGAADNAPQVALGMLLWVRVWWMTEFVPLGLLAVTVPLVFLGSGIISWKKVLTVFVR